MISQFKDRYKTKISHGLLVIISEIENYLGCNIVVAQVRVQTKTQISLERKKKESCRILSGSNKRQP